MRLSVCLRRFERFLKMKKTWRKTAILFVIPLLVIVSIVCCCFADKAQAAQQSTPSCHASDEAQQSDDVSGSSEECDCARATSILSQRILLTYNSNVSTFPNVKSILLLKSIASDASFGAIAVLAHQGPPQLFDSLPIYLKNSNLRL